MHDEHGERAVASGGGMDGPGDAFCVVISSIPGYFAAMEQLKLYVSDVRTFARTVRWSLAARAITGSSY
jgi:hypothetical protein